MPDRPSLGFAEGWLSEGSTPGFAAELARGGQTAVVCRLVSEHGSAIYEFCCTLVGDATLAEDVRQQVFLEAWRDIGRFQGRSSLRTWLFGIATHRSLDALRARRARHKFVSEYEAKAIPDPGPMPDERLDNARLDQVLAECLAEILPSTRQAILMRFELGLTFDELAEICGEHPEALRARVTRALPVLRSRIEARLGIAGGGR